MIGRLGAGLALWAALAGLLTVGVASANAAGLVPAPGSPFSSGFHPVSVVAGHFNGDGAFDVAVVNTTSGDVSVLLGGGHGSLAAAPGSPFPTGAPLNPVSLAAGDFNMDTRLDVAVASDSGTVSVLLGNGQGGLGSAPGSPFATKGLRPIAVAAGDLNGDGKPDVAVAHNGSGDVSVLLGNGQGGLSPAPGSPFATKGLRPSSVAVGDLNGDGKADVAVAHTSSGDVSVLLANGQGGLSSAPGSPFATRGLRPISVALGDFNRDGKPDAAAANQSSGDVSILLGDGQGSLKRAPSSPYAVGAFHPASVAVGNLNPGGKPDVVVASGSGDVSALLGDGHGRLNPALGSPFLARGFHPASVGVADFNGDGRLDVTVANSDSDNTSVLLNQGLSVARRCTILGRRVTMTPRGVVTVRLTCPFRASGTVGIRTAGATRSAAGARKRGVRLGHRRFKIFRAGQTATVKVKLSRRGQRLVRRHKLIRAKATAVVRRRGAASGAAATRSKGTITIKAPKKR